MPVRYRMAERGRIVFAQYCEHGRSAWVEATNKEGRIVVLHVGHEESSSVVPGFLRRPYLIARVRKKAEPKGRSAS